MLHVALTISLVSLFAMMTSSTVWAWGAEGHEAVCEIAYQELNSEARTQVDAIMAAEDDDRFKTFRQGCGWPDHRRRETNERREDHYINVPRDWTTISNSTCVGVEHCLFSAIIKDTDVLRDANASLANKLMALKFLGHWVGDIHQPLHVSYRDDRGGNDILLSRGIGCERKLHDVWDNCIPEDIMQEMGLAGERQGFGETLRSEITEAQRQTWRSEMSLATWASESLQIARLPDAQYCVIQGDRCNYTADQAEYIKNEGAENEGKKVLSLSRDYEDQFHAAVKHRLQMAGVRLGHLLNQLFSAP
jgi:hypothetical protein